MGIRWRLCLGNSLPRISFTLVYIRVAHYLKNAYIHLQSLTKWHQGQWCWWRRFDSISETFFWSNIIVQNLLIASLYSCCLLFSKQEQTQYPGKPTMDYFRYVNCDFWDRSLWQILKMTLPQKNGHRIKTPSSKLIILVVILLEKEFYTQ